MTTFRSQPRSLWVIALLTLLLLTFGLGSFGLLEDNDARFFEISWEMLKSNDWLTPRLNFIAHFHKPPGTFWLVAASMKLCGQSEWAARLPVALAAMLTLGLTWAWLASETDYAQAYRAALVLLTSLEFWFLSRLVLTDMFLTLSVTSMFFFAWRSRALPQSYFWLWFWLAMTASMLFKGPIGLAIVAPVLIIFKLTNSSDRPWNLRPLLGIPIFLGLSSPWYAYVCSQHAGLLDYFLNFQTKQRMFTTVHGRPGPWWFYLPALAAGFFPWSATLPVALIEGWKSKSEFDRFLIIWISVPLIFFSCAGSKLPTYLLPIFPALAMLTARSCRNPRLTRLLGSLTLAALTLLALALAIYLIIGVAPELAPAKPYLWALAALCGLSSLIANTLGSHLDSNAWFDQPGWTFALSLLILASALGPCDEAYSARKLAHLIQQHQPKGGDIVEVGVHLHGLPYYLDRRLIQVSYPREVQFESTTEYKNYLYPDLSAYLASHKISPSTLIIIRRSEHEKHSNPAWRYWEMGRWGLLQPAPASPPPLSKSDRPSSAWTIAGNTSL